MNKKWLVALVMALPLSMSSFAQPMEEEEEELMARPNPMENRAQGVNNKASQVMAEEEEAQTRNVNTKAVKLQQKGKVMERNAAGKLNQKMQQGR